jgi:hypothetical protein
MTSTDVNDFICNIMTPAPLTGGCRASCRLRACPATGPDATFPTPMMASWGIMRHHEDRKSLQRDSDSTRHIRRASP